MTLRSYHTKRAFDETPEPLGKKRTVARHKPLEFVVQRHKASRLHYDFRLELEGALVSWAVPKGPSMNPDDKRLAMKVEDHPYEYRTFKGVIPEGNYGAGIVEIWDYGTYVPYEEISGKTDVMILKAGLRRGDLKVVLRGRKLKGAFAIVAMKSQQENAWLLIKKRDAHAVTKPYDAERLTTKSSPINKALAKKPKLAKRPRAKAA